MKENKNIINGIEVEIKAGLFVDEKTFRTCMNLISIYAENNGIKGMIIRFDDGLRDAAAIYEINDDRDIYEIMNYADSLQNISSYDLKTKEE